MNQHTTALSCAKSSAGENRLEVRYRAACECDASRSSFLFTEKVRMANDFHLVLSNKSACILVFVAK